jgi:hypothetical protein
VVIAVIDYQTDRQSLVNLGATQRGAYVANAPFSHIVIDEFFDADAMNAALAEIDAVDRSKRYAKFIDRKTDHNKFAFFPGRSPYGTTGTVFELGPILGLF